MMSSSSYVRQRAKTWKSLKAWCTNSSRIRHGVGTDLFAFIPLTPEYAENSARVTEPVWYGFLKMSRKLVSTITGPLARVSALNVQEVHDFYSTWDKLWNFSACARCHLQASSHLGQPVQAAAVSRLCISSMIAYAIYALATPGNDKMRLPACTDGLRSCTCNKSQWCDNRA